MGRAGLHVDLSGSVELHTINYSTQFAKSIPGFALTFSRMSDVIGRKWATITVRQDVYPSINPIQ
jgi:hypothetical protein